MKKLIGIICIFFAVTALYAKGIQDDYRAEDEKTRTSYAFGMIMGSNLESMPLEFDYYAFAEGLKSILEENVESQFSQQEAYEIVEGALQEAMNKMSAGNLMMEDEFLAANAKRPGVTVTKSGLQYEIVKDSDGEKPTIDSVVKVNYTGTFIDGTLFDSSGDESALIPLEMVIEGWSEGLMLMPVGSKYRIYVPSNLAYGKDGIQGIIPPYSTLIFDVELLEITEGEF